MNILSPSFRKEIIEGNNKTLYRTDEKGVLNLLFKEENEVIAYIKKNLSEKLFNLLKDCNVPNHFISCNGVNEQKVKALEMLPFIFSIYTFADKNLASKFHLKPGLKLQKPLVEINFKDKNNSTSVSKEHVLSFGWLDEKSFDTLMFNIEKAMTVIYSFFKAIGATVFSLNLEFGKSYKNSGSLSDCFLGDELSLNNINLKVDGFLSSSLEDKYIEIGRRLGIIKE